MNNRFHGFSFFIGILCGAGILFLVFNSLGWLALPVQSNVTESGMNSVAIDTPTESKEVYDSVSAETEGYQHRLDQIIGNLEKDKRLTTRSLKQVRSKLNIFQNVKKLPADDHQCINALAEVKSLEKRLKDLDTELRDLSQTKGQLSVLVMSLRSRDRPIVSAIEQDTIRQIKAALDVYGETAGPVTIIPLEGD